LSRIYLSDVIRDEFEKNETQSLKDLFEVVQAHENYSHLSPKNIKHKIRSTIYSMQQSNEIQKVGTALYKKV